MKPTKGKYDVAFKKAKGSIILIDTHVKLLWKRLADMEFNQIKSVKHMFNERDIMIYAMLTKNKYREKTLTEKEVANILNVSISTIRNRFSCVSCMLDYAIRDFENGTAILKDKKITYK